mmetsp:Transcript_44695/g.106057  ORF Transcript_44695/g.106057 Transcript_44695/m.106057 type:complete len:967 (-) Transcript_44695:44-2944(-)
MTACRQVVSIVWDQLDNTRPLSARQICPSGIVQRRCAQIEQGDRRQLEVMSTPALASVHSPTYSQAGSFQTQAGSLQAFPSGYVSSSMQPRVASPRLATPRSPSSPQASPRPPPAAAAARPAPPVSIAQSVQQRASELRPPRPAGVSMATSAAASGTSTPAMPPPKFLTGGSQTARARPPAQARGGTSSNAGSLTTTGGSSTSSKRRVTPPPPPGASNASGAMVPMAAAASYTPHFGGGHGGATASAPPSAAFLRQASFGALPSSRGSSQNGPERYHQQAVASEALQPSPSTSPRHRLPSREERLPSKGHHSQGPRGGTSPRGVHTPRGPSGSKGHSQQDLRSGRPKTQRSQDLTPRSQNSASGQAKGKGYCGTPRTMVSSTPPPPLPPPGFASSGSVKARGGGSRGRQADKSEPRTGRPGRPGQNQDFVCSFTPRRQPAVQNSNSARRREAERKAQGVGPQTPATLKQQPTPVDLLDDLTLSVPHSQKAKEAFSIRAETEDSNSIYQAEPEPEGPLPGDIPTERTSETDDMRRPPSSRWVFDTRAIHANDNRHDEPLKREQQQIVAAVPVAAPLAMQGVCRRDVETPEEAELEMSGFSVHSETSPMLQPPPGTWGGGVFENAAEPTPMPIHTNVVMCRLVASVTEKVAESFNEAIRSLSPCCHQTPVSGFSPRVASPDGGRSPFGPRSTGAGGQLRPPSDPACRADHRTPAREDHEWSAMPPQVARQPFHPQQNATGGFITPRKTTSSLATPRGEPGSDAPQGPHAFADTVMSSQQEAHLTMCTVHSGDVDDVQGVNDASFDRSIAGSPIGSPSILADEAVVAEETSSTGCDGNAGRLHPALGEGFRMPDLPMPAGRKNPGSALSTGTTSATSVASGYTAQTTASGGKGLSARPAAHAPGQPKQTVFFPAPPIHASEPVFHKGHHQSWMRKNHGRTPPPKGGGFSSPRGAVSPRQASTAGRRGGA